MSKQQTGIEKVLNTLKMGKKVTSKTFKLKNVRATITDLRRKGYVIPHSVDGSYLLDKKKTAKKLLK